jgi:hypothetical protein
MERNVFVARKFVVAAWYDELKLLVLRSAIYIIRRLMWQGAMLQVQ